jgi:hypothetical protein
MILVCPRPSGLDDRDVSAATFRWRHYSPTFPGRNLAHIHERFYCNRRFDPSGRTDLRCLPSREINQIGRSTSQARGQRTACKVDGKDFYAAIDRTRGSRKARYGGRARRSVPAASPPLGGARLFFAPWTSPGVYWVSSRTVMNTAGCAELTCHFFR